ncbi:MAG: SDR family NAD(P)-dependent oxidoreductase [Pseudomonadota bacterium]
MTEIVWITGASKGIGRALALEMASRGRTVVASARSEDELKDLANEASAHSGTIVGYPLDVTDLGAVKQAIGAIEAQHGAIDTAVLNAGTHQPVTPQKFSVGDMRKLFELNVFGTANCIEALLPPFLERKRGRLAIVASVAGYGGLPTAAYYGSSKAAMINLAETLRLDLAKTDIVVQCINPGFVKTPLTDKNKFKMPFLIEAEVAAKRIADGLATDRFEIAFPRPFIAIMKFLRLLPYSLYFGLISRQTGS